ncbi:MAG: hypothetical protein JNG86_20690 [Verrucomicrobiaceae bacterium]|nr:hypothetical protein [Verrucomicrobiaceae bacterium]
MNKAESILAAIFWALVLLPTPGSSQNSSIEQADELLQRGDLSPIHDAVTQDHFALLWHCFEKALGRSYGKGLVEGGEEARDALNKRIQAAAGEKLRSMPGHARFLADEIARLGPSNPGRRQDCFRCLGQLGGKEAVQQIGRFMYEEFIVDLAPQRQLKEFGSNPTATKGIPFLECGTQNELRKPESNDRMAALAMHYALGADTPCVSMFPGATWVPASAPVIEKWWRSDASLPYRQQLPGVELPEMVRNPPSAAEVEARRQEAEARFEAVSPEAGGEQLPMWVNIAGLIAALGLVVWLAAHKRGKPLANPERPALR